METIANIGEIPELNTGAVHIWGARVPELKNRLPELHALLSQEEQEKAARFRREADRETSIVARGALRVLLAVYSGEAPEKITFEYSENGKPFFQSSDVGFNVSHSGEWVVLAFGRACNIGVDVEKIRRELDVLAIADRYFTAEETDRIKSSADMHATFFHFWARKEAYVKAAGSALFRELSSFSVPENDTEKEGWFFRRLEAGSKYASAVVTDKPIESFPCFDFAQLDIF